MLGFICRSFVNGHEEGSFESAIAQVNIVLHKEGEMSNIGVGLYVFVLNSLAERRKVRIFARCTRPTLEQIVVVKVVF